LCGEAALISSLGPFRIGGSPLLAPARLTGGTLALLGKYASRPMETAGSRIGLRYALNTAGAALGYFATDSALIRPLGILGTAILAAAVDVSVGIRAGARGHLRDGREIPTGTWRARPGHPRPPRMAYDSCVPTTSPPDPNLCKLNALGPSASTPSGPVARLSS